MYIYKYKILRCFFFLATALSCVFVCPPVCVHNYSSFFAFLCKVLFFVDSLLVDDILVCKLASRSVF